MSSPENYNELIEQKFIEMNIVYAIDDSEPLAEAFEAYAGQLMSSWAIYALSHEAPESFMMLLFHISKMRRIDLVGVVAMAVGKQAFNPYGNTIPKALDAIMGVLEETPSLTLIVETFNALGHDQAARIEGDTIRFASS